MGRPSKGLRLAITVRMPADLYRRVNLAASNRHQTVVDWVLDAIRAHLAATPDG